MLFLPPLKCLLFSEKIAWAFKISAMYGLCICEWATDLHYTGKLGLQCIWLKVMPSGRAISVIENSTFSLLSFAFFSLHLEEGCAVIPYLYTSSLQASLEVWGGEPGFLQVCTPEVIIYSKSKKKICEWRFVHCEMFHLTNWGQNVNRKYAS